MIFLLANGLLDAGPPEFNYSHLFRMEMSVKKVSKHLETDKRYSKYEIEGMDYVSDYQYLVIIFDEGGKTGVSHICELHKILAFVLR